ncbi:MAG: sulfatase-like hydrolase/transferase [Lentisphaerae bacterium]|nr:sulfatase-like hydrolase/transferase [Lentisphaerota bacterium]
MTAPKNLPHIVLILCDQLRTDALGFMGNRLARTPNLDALARAGTVFENLFVQAPVCMSSRASLLTGRYPRTARMGGGSPLLDPREVTLAEILQHADYRTGLFGKLHLTPQEYTLKTLGSDRTISDARVFLEAAGLPPMPDDPCKRNYGFQHVVGHEDLLWGEYRDWLRARDASLAARLPERPWAPWPGWRRLCAEAAHGLPDVGPTILPPDLHPSIFIAQSAADFFSARHAEGPCFLHVSFTDPHPPFAPPEELFRLFPPDAMPLPRYADTGALRWPASLRERWPDFSGVTPENTRAVIACYYAMIAMIDRALGHLIAAITATGDLERTLFVFTADHGEFLGDYGLFRKGAFHYDCLLRAPGFVSWRGQLPAGRRLTGLTQTIDLAPTILGLAGMPPAAGMQGNDLALALARSEQIGRPWTYTESYRALWGPFVDCWTLRTAGAKLNYYPRDRTGHLFDLAQDPDERRDLFDDPARRALRDDLLATLIEAVHSQTDPLPRVMCQY